MIAKLKMPKESMSVSDLDNVAELLKDIQTFKDKNMKAGEFLRLAKVMTYRFYKQDTTIFNYGR